MSASRPARRNTRSQRHTNILASTPAEAAITSESNTASATPQPDPLEHEPIWRASLKLLRPAIVATLAITIVTGIIYPLVVMGLAQAIFPSQANGSIIYVNGRPVASSLIGEYWTAAKYFHGRPSATLPGPYNASSSGGSNLGPTNSALKQTVQQRIAALRKENPDVPTGTPIPVDLVTASASGVDPDISVAGAYYQIPRVAKARHLSQATVTQIVNAHIEGRFLGVFGEPRINVVLLNMALDAYSRDHAQHSQSGVAMTDSAFSTLFAIKSTKSKYANEG
ncbi:MAG TPA: potassium-transporting ATPase subunit KdpC [Ktedonobacterales bacterium]|nr:potassium-transporting ATPase subunit KdpC [Ktedonobacterales bacterium]